MDGKNYQGFLKKFIEKSIFYQPINFRMQGYKYVGMLCVKRKSERGT